MIPIGGYKVGQLVVFSGNGVSNLTDSSSILKIVVPTPTVATTPDDKTQLQKFKPLPAYRLIHQKGRKGKIKRW